MAVGAWQILDTTLREGEQFARSNFALEDKIALARLLDAFGVERLELTTPVASPASRRACERIAGMGLRAKVLAHTRVSEEDVQAAIDAGVDGVDLLFATSDALRRAGHGRSIEELLERTLEVVRFARQQGLEVRFSCEDAFRTPWPTLRRVYRALDRDGVDRLGVADTIGIATPSAVRRLIGDLRHEVAAPLEFHGHDDTGCAVANAFEAVEAGAAWIDTSVLGLGERNGITPLGGFIARMYAQDPQGVGARYRLDLLPELDRTVARMAGVEVPFNTCLTGAYAYHHKAGLHLHAILRDPHAYEAVPAEALGLHRTLELGSRLVGRHALAHRARELAVELDDAALRRLTRAVKQRADDGAIAPADLDAMISRAARAQAAAGDDDAADERRARPERAEVRP